MDINTIRSTNQKDSRTGRFQKTPNGQKTARMLTVEEHLGRTLEEDYRDFYVEKDWGQAKIAQRWGVPRGLIFYSNPRLRSRSWVEQLNLPKHGPPNSPPTSSPPATSPSRRRCECCGDDKFIPERAHWIARKDGGSTQRFNIILLCPNHHQALDRDDPATIEAVKEILLFREAKRIIQTGPDGVAKRKEVLTVCQAIINRRLS